MKSDELREWVQTIAAETMVNSVALLEDLQNSLRLASNVEIGNAAKNLAGHAIGIYGCYLVQQRLISSIEDKDLFKQLLRDAYLDYVVSTWMSIKDEEQKTAKKEIGAMFDADTLLYSQTIGGVGLTFKEKLRGIFNTYSPIKFIDNTFSNRFKLKTARFLGAGNTKFIEEHGNDFYMQMEVLDKIVAAITQSFLELDVKTPGFSLRV